MQKFFYAQRLILAALYGMQRCKMLRVQRPMQRMLQRCMALRGCNVATSPYFGSKSARTLNEGTFSMLHGVLDVATLATLLCEQSCNAFYRCMQRKYDRNKLSK